VKFLVLKDLPQGQQPGDVIDIHEDIGKIFMLPGVEAVKPLEEDEAVEPVETSTPRRRYQRRDLEAKTT
jgi:hypothetical protein